MLTYVSLQVINFVASLSLVCGTIHVSKSHPSWLTINELNSIIICHFQKRPKLVIVWLVSQAFIIIFWTLGSVVTNDINMVLYAVFFIYFWICVYSLYKEMNLELYQQSLHYSIQAVWIRFDHATDVDSWWKHMTGEFSRRRKSEIYCTHNSNNSRYNAVRV